MSALELREDGTGWTLLGYGSTFNAPYRIGPKGPGGFTEIVRPGAFRQTLSSNPRVDLLLNHGRSGSGMALASTANGSMALAEDSHGLRMEAKLIPGDADAQLVRTKIQNGLAREMSFSFSVLGGDSGQRWSDDRSRRELLALDIDGGDLSVCDHGANAATRVDVRGGDLAEAVGLEVRGYTPLTPEIRGGGTTNSTEEVELEWRALEYAASGRAADLRQAAQLASPDAQLARAVAVSRRSELELELLLAKGRRR